MYRSNRIIGINHVHYITFLFSLDEHHLIYLSFYDNPPTCAYKINFVIKRHSSISHYHIDMAKFQNLLTWAVFIALLVQAMGDVIPLAKGRAGKIWHDAHATFYGDLNGGETMRK